MLDPSRVAAFYAFILERESIRLRRAAGLPREEWTSDPIFRTYSFTNVKRHHDRTTTLLFREFYREDLARHSFTPHEESLELCRTTLLNCALFRYFGTIEMARAIGWASRWDAETSLRIRTTAEIRLLERDTVFTSAYLVPNCGSTSPKHEIVSQIMDLIWTHSQYVLDSNEWRVMCERLCHCWGVGPFMAKEVLLDYILATGWEPADWKTWTPIGPGGQRGAGRILHGALVKIPEREALEVIRELYEARLDHWPPYAGPSVLGYESSAAIKMVELDLTDVQFQLCEFDKYSRVAEGRRPKRNFKPTIDDVTQEA